MEKSRRGRTGIVYSTDPGFEYTCTHHEEEETPLPGRQLLYVSVDRRQRRGKTVTLISGFSGKTEDLKELAALLRSKCSAGGTVKDGEILIQGDFRDRVIRELEEMGYKTRRKGS